MRIPDGVTELRPRALQGNTAIKRLDLNGVRLVGEEALAGLTELLELKAPHVETLEQGALRGSGAGQYSGRGGMRTVYFTDLSLPSAKYIGDEALQVAVTLRYMGIPRAVRIGAAAV